MSKKVYLYNDWHNGDVITNRALIKSLLPYGLDLAVGSYKDRHYLVADLPVRHIISPIHECFSSNNELVHLCPEGYIAVNGWGGRYADLNNRYRHSWPNIAETWNRQSREHEIGIFLGDKEAPFFDFRYPCRIKTRGRGIYIETSQPRALGYHRCFYFDMDKLGSLFPDFNFYTTSGSNCKLPNVIDCGHLNLIDLSFISNGCEAIVGRGSGPFACTYTEPNRNKPRATVGFIRSPEDLWTWEGSPIRFLQEETELIAFLQEVYDNPLKEV